MQAKEEGEAMDISHGLPFAPSLWILFRGSYEDIADAAVVIITAGANQKPGETRLDLVQKNSKIMKSIISEIKTGKLRRNSDDRIKSGGYSDAGCPERIRISERARDRFWYGALIQQD